MRSKKTKTRTIGFILIIAQISVLSTLVIWYHVDYYNPDLVFDVNDISHSVEGFGAQVWEGDNISKIDGLIKELNLKLVRMSKGSYNSPLDITGWNRSDYNAFYNPQVKIAFVDMLEQNNISIMINFFGFPSNWKDASGTILPGYNQPFAMLAGAFLYQLSLVNFIPAYFEPFNEPDGSWNGRIPPEDYNEIVKYLHAELDYYNLTNISIVGPGRAHIDVGENDEYIEMLDNQGVASIGAWSIHGWEWDDATRSDPSIVRDSYRRGFGASVKRKDPNQSKPIIITEYSTFAYDKDPPSSETAGFATRVYENTLSFINEGANAAIYWQAADQTWDPNNTWSFLRVDGSGRPVYDVIKTLYPKITGFDVVDIIDQAYGVYSGVYVKNNTMIIALVNNDDVEHGINVKPSGISGMTLVEAIGFQGGSIVNYSLSMDVEHVTLPALSTLTLNFSIQKN
ncbi:MAG: hypothetical protein ACFFCS_24195 [Candidatus Hodarchaeota archaeon]